MSKARRNIRRFLDVAIVSCVIAVVWGGMRLTEPKAGGDFASAGIRGLNTELAIPDIEWRESERTVLLFASATCPACVESAPLYRELAERLVDRPNTRFAVVSEEPTSTTRAWLEREGIRPAFVAQIRSPSSFGFFATPTLAIIGQSGKVRDIYVGKLPDRVQEQLWARALGSEDVPAIDNTYTSREIDDRGFELLRRRAVPQPQVLDIRPRTAYDTEHRIGAVNIPRAELSVRAPIELRTDRAIVIDCEALSPIICWSAANYLGQLDGFDDVYVLTASR